MNRRALYAVFGALVGIGVALGLLAVVFSTSATGRGGAAGGGHVPTPRSLEASGSTSPPSIQSSGVASGAASGGSSPASDQAGGTAPARQPDQPAANGAKLSGIGNPPPDTVAMIETGAAKAGSAYDVTFTPFGLGPSGASDQLVIRVLGSTPRAGITKPFAFANRNVLANVAADSVGKVKTGGEYRGVIVLTAQGGLLVPRLTKVAAVKSR